MHSLCPTNRANKFPHTQASSFEMFFGWQRFNAPMLMATYMELRLTIKKQNEGLQPQMVSQRSCNAI